jgi:membrane peptidoglycan carboxypeptidase
MGGTKVSNQGPRWRRGLQITAACFVVLVGEFAVGTAVAGPFFWYSCSLNGLEAHGASQASILLSSDGTRLGMLGASGDRLPVSLRQVSPVMRKAIVDTEDQRFYSNNGIDYIGIMRALTRTLTRCGRPGADQLPPRTRQGASQATR